MKLIIGNKKITFGFIIPNSLVINKLILNKVLENFQINLDHKQIKMIKNEVRKLKKKYRGFTLIDVQTKEKEKFIVKL